MMNKVIVFVKFGPNFDDVFITFLDKDSILCIYFQWRARKLS